MWIIKWTFNWLLSRKMWTIVWKDLTFPRFSPKIKRFQELLDIMPSTHYNLKAPHTVELNKFSICKIVVLQATVRTNYLSWIRFTSVCMLGSGGSPSDTRNSMTWISSVALNSVMHANTLYSRKQIPCLFPRILETWSFLIKHLRREYL